MAEKTSSGTNYEHGSNFRVAEAYRTIRTNLLFTLANADSNIVVVSSAEPSAGKSTLVANLAIVMAQTGARVVLVDADMRKPVLHRSFRVSKTNGLSKVLGGLLTLDEAICPSVAQNLDLIPAGSIPPNPSELLGTERMKKTLATLSEQYDYVFIDTPPIGVVTDAMVLSPAAAGIVLVARQKHTNYDDLQDTVEAVKQADGNLLGVVITDVRQEGVGYSHYGRYGRYSRYGRYYKSRYYRSYEYRYAAQKENENG